MSGLKALESSVVLALGAAAGLNLRYRNMDKMDREATLAEMKRRNELAAELKNELSAEVNSISAEMRKHKELAAEILKLKNQGAEP